MIAVFLLLISRLSGHPRYYELDAEREGFEPSVRLPARLLSKQVP